MTAKKTTKKPRAKRKPKATPFRTVELPKQATPNLVENVKSALDALAISPGWQIICKILNDNIDYLEMAILERIDPKTKALLSHEEVEELRKMRSLNIEVRDTPKNYKKHLEKTGIVPKEFDPYFKTRSEIQKADRLSRQ